MSYISTSSKYLIPRYTDILFELRGPRDDTAWEVLYLDFLCVPLISLDAVVSYQDFIIRARSFIFTVIAALFKVMLMLGCELRYTGTDLSYQLMHASIYDRVKFSMVRNQV